MRYGYKQMRHNPMLYPSQTLFDMILDAETDDEFEAVHIHLVFQGVFDNPKGYPEYIDVSDFIKESLFDQNVQHDEESLQNRIDQYFIINKRHIYEGEE